MYVNGLENSITNNSCETFLNGESYDFLSNMAVSSGTVNYDDNDYEYTGYVELEENDEFVIWWHSDANIGAVPSTVKVYENGVDPSDGETIVMQKPEAITDEYQYWQGIIIPDEDILLM